MKKFVTNGLLAANTIVKRTVVLVMNGILNISGNAVG